MNRLLPRATRFTDAVDRLDAIAIQGVQPRHDACFLQFSPMYSAGLGLMATKRLLPRNVPRHGECDVLLLLKKTRGGATMVKTGNTCESPKLEFF